MLTGRSTDATPTGRGTGRLKVRDLMTKGVVAVRADHDLGALHDLMLGRDIRHAPVVNEQGELIGLVSQRDLLRHVLSFTDELPISNRRELLHGMCVGEIMVEEVEAADPDQPLAEAAAVMLENKFGCLPVVDGLRLVGILTEADFVRFVMERG